MAINVNIFELTRQAFNISGFTPILSGNQQSVVVDNSQIQVYDVPQSIGSSILGTPIFESIAFQIPDSSEMYYFDHAPMVQVKLRKNIVKSEITNRPGTVKEYINIDDYRVKIQGLLVNHNGDDAPFEAIEILKQIVAPGVALRVESKLLQIFGIYNLVVGEFDFKPLTKYPNTMGYEFDCLSDEPIELVLKDPDFSPVNFLE